VQASGWSSCFPCHARWPRDVHVSPSLSHLTGGAAGVHFGASRFPQSPAPKHREQTSTFRGGHQATQAALLPAVPPPLQPPAAHPVIINGGWRRSALWRLSKGQGRAASRSGSQGGDGNSTAGEHLTLGGGGDALCPAHSLHCWTAGIQDSGDSDSEITTRAVRTTPMPRLSPSAATLRPRMLVNDQSR
jgi:hypothetical protein